MGEIIDGFAAAKALRERVQQEIAVFQRTHGFPPGLATVLVGDNAASASYVRGKRKACHRFARNSSFTASSGTSNRAPTANHFSQNAMVCSRAFE